jgi:pimeloyl-ACP methyl ester carboxylesterase
MQTFVNEANMGAPASHFLAEADTHYLEQGQGVPFVLIHGAVSDHRIWEAQRENIAASYRYLALDLDYHGPHAWKDKGERYSILHHVAQVKAFIDALDAGPVHLVGQSYGGHVALRVALEAGHTVRSLVLQEPSVQSFIEGPEAPAIMEEWQRRFGPAMAAAGQGKLEAAARLMVEALLNQSALDWDAGPADLAAMVRDNARTLPLMFSAPWAPALNGEQLASLAMPALIINGENTLQYFSFPGERIAQCIPGAQRAVIANASHGVETQNPEAYWSVVKDFLRRAEAMSGR